MRFPIPINSKSDREKTIQFITRLKDAGFPTAKIIETANIIELEISDTVFTQRSFFHEESICEQLYYGDILLISIQGKKVPYYLKEALLPEREVVIYPDNIAQLPKNLIRDEQTWLAEEAVIDQAFKYFKTLDTDFPATKEEQNIYLHALLSYHYKQAGFFEPHLRYKISISLQRLAQKIQNFMRFTKDPFKPYHPGLPTIAQAQMDYETFLSDHIPVIADINGIRCVSWNVMEGDAFNGVAPLRASSYGETPKQRQARYERIAEAIAKILEVQQPDFFTLQEIRAKMCGPDGTEIEGLWSVIAKRLQSTPYAPAEENGNVIDTAGNITLYNQNKFTLNLEKTPIHQEMRAKLDGSFDNLGAHALVFNHRENLIQQDAAIEIPKIRICNVHAAYNDNPTHHAQMINAFLNAGGPQDTSIVIGDFNCMVDTLSGAAQITATSLTPNMFRNYTMQGACAIDGAFAKTGDAQNCQIAAQHINPATATIYHPQALALPDIEDRPIEQVEEETRFRPMICLSEKPYATLKALINTSIGGHYISIGLATNLRIERALALHFPSDTEEYFKNIGLPSNRLIDQHRGTSSRVAYLPLETAENALKNTIIPEILKNRFMRAYKKKLQDDKMAYCGLFRICRKSRVTDDMTLANIIAHAQKANNRSRSVCIELGWLNAKGKITKNAPDTIRNIDNAHATNQPMAMKAGQFI